MYQARGEDEDWLSDVANEMDQEHGLIWVYGSGDEGIMAFTDFGIETLPVLKFEEGARIHAASGRILDRHLCRASA